MQRITPHIWFDKNAEEAVELYTSIFRDGKVHSTTRYTEAGKEIHDMEAGTVLTMEFEVDGYRLVALNGGPHFTPNPSISFFISREKKEEIDELWEKLTDGGTILMPLQEYPFSKHYGWVQDRFGVSWQLILPDTEGDWRPELMPSLLFTQDMYGKTEEAINFYTSLFPDSKIGMIARYGEGQEPEQEGRIMYSDFTLAGQWFAAMESAAGHQFTFNEGISLLVTCKDQGEIDRLWEALSAVPASEQCGWLKDKYGVSWQIVPEGMDTMLNDPNREKADRAMNAMLQMKKIDIAKLTEAFNG